MPPCCAKRCTPCYNSTSKDRFALSLPTPFPWPKLPRHTATSRSAATLAKCCWQQRLRVGIQSMVILVSPVTNANRLITLSVLHLFLPCCHLSTDHGRLDARKTTTRPRCYACNSTHDMWLLHSV